VVLSSKGSKGLLVLFLGYSMKSFNYFFFFFGDDIIGVIAKGDLGKCETEADSVVVSLSLG